MRSYVELLTNIVCIISGKDMRRKVDRELDKKNMK